MESDMRLFMLLFSLWIMPVFAVAGEEEKEGGPAIEYLEMAPKFTVNLAEPKKYLLINVQLLVEGDAAIVKIKKHLPALRHELIMLFSGRPAASLQTMEQREALRQDAILAIRQTLDKHENSDGLRDVFFTEFLTN
jgi:flagellar protein FliL